MENIYREELSDLFQCIANLMEENESELERLDSLMGDGDLGLTMKKGYMELPKIVKNSKETDLSKTIVEAGMKLSSIIPSTMGFLMSSAIMYAGKAVKDEVCINQFNFLSFLKGFENGIVKRGKCKEGERTVLDSISSAVYEVTEAIQENLEIGLEALALKAVVGAKKGLEATRNMEPKYGKAAVHRNAARGEVDQGALAGYYLIEGIYNFIKGK